MYSLKTNQGTGGLNQFFFFREGTDDIVHEIIHTEDFSRREAAVRLTAESTALIPDFSLEGREGSFLQFLAEMMNDSGGIRIETF